MSGEIWSHWGWPLATAVLGYVFTTLLVMQWLERRKPHQLAWALGFLFYSVAATMEALSEWRGAWDPAVYRVYIVLAASLVGFLGLGTLYLITKKRIWGNLYLAFNLACLAIFAYGVAVVDLDLAKLSQPGITIGGAGLGTGGSFPRIMSLPFNIPGSLLLLGGSALSIVRFWGKREYRYRVHANALIILGTLVIAGAGSMARAGMTAGLYPAEMVASALLLWGFLLAGTLEKGATAVKTRLAEQRESSP